MASRVTRVSGIIASGAAVVGVVAGCSSSTPTDPLHPSNVVLSQEELPGGLTTVKLGKDELKQLTDQLHDATKKTTVTPSKCAGPGSVASSIDAKTVGIMAARNGSFSVSESVDDVSKVSGGVDLVAAKARVTGDCARVVVSVGAGPIKDAGVTVENTVLDVARGVADQVLVVQSSSKTVRGSRTGSQDLLVGRAVVKGYAVTVQMSSLTGSGNLDAALFQQVFTKAIAKAANQ